MMLAAILVTVFATCRAQVIGVGPCPPVVTQPTFELERYLGKWYQAHAFPFFFTGDGKCVTAEYSLNDDFSVKVNNTKFQNGVYQSDIGRATIPDPENAPSTLCVRFAENQPCGDYRVLATDYETYTLIHACNQLGGAMHGQTNWILSRTPILDDAIYQQLRQLADSFGIPVDEFLPTVQDCGN